MFKLSPLAPWVFVCVSLVLVVPARASDRSDLARAEPAPGSLQPTSAPTDVIKRLNAVLLGLMQQADTLGYEGRARSIEAAVRETYDLVSIARVALGKQWRSLDETERQQFTMLLERLIVANYASSFDGYAGETFRVIAEEEAPQGLRLVKSRILKSDGEKVALDYRLRQVDGTWRIVDVFLNGTVSELALRRAEYSSVIERKGYPALLEALEDRIAAMSASATAAP